MTNQIQATLKNGYTVSTVFINGTWETMVFDTDFEELAQERCTSKETAIKLHGSFILKYSNRQDDYEDYVYQFHTEKKDDNGIDIKNEFLTLNEAEAKYKKSGYLLNHTARNELQGQPKFQGFAGPMFNRFDEYGKITIRYERRE